jgi:mono/diheme cytochrome c family protein
VTLAAAACGSGTIGYTSGGDRAAGKDLFVKGVSGAPSCGSCHTLADAGTSGQVGPNLDAAFRESRENGLRDSTIHQVVADQIFYPTEQPGTGSPGMPDVDVTLPECASGETEGCVPDQREAASDIAAYVAAVAGTGAAPTPGPTTPGTTTDEESGGGSPTAAGKQVFETAGCASCHTLADAGSNGQVGPNLDDAKPSKELVTERVTNGQGAMPPFKGQLTDDQIEAVAAYVSSVAGK